MPEGQGFFVTFEGSEGGGKSTQVRLLAERLRAEGRAVTLTREPGGTPASDRIREVLLDPALTISPLTEFLLYSASRAQHVEEVIQPALTRGDIVISDRFFGASVAYQGYGRGLDLSFIHELTTRVTGGLTPDLTFLLDIEPSKGLERVAGRGQKDRLELADLAFHERVRAGFLKQAQGRADWVIVDAQDTLETLHETLWRTLRKRLPF